MSDLWKRCEGQLVDNQFPLLQFLANTNHSAVFLTEAAQGKPRKSTIKFISADIPEPDKQLAIWAQTSKLSHPHLLRIFHSGRWRMVGTNLLYVVMEIVDEELSKFLTQHALTPREARDLLEPLVEAFTYLHGRGLVHGHVKPSNVCAIADQLKLSSDTIAPIGHARESHRDLDVYDAPENSASPLITAALPADVWSLGITLVEGLTHQVPALPFDDAVEMSIPETIPAPFLDIARHALVRDPSRRWTISEIEARLNPAPLAAAATATASSSAGTSASASSPALASAAATQPPAMGMANAPAISPMSVPISREPAMPPAKLPQPTALPPRREGKSQSDKTIALPSYVIPLAVLGILVLAIAFTLPKVIRRVMGATGAATSPTASSTTKQTGVEQAGSAAAKTPAKPAADAAAQPAIKQNNTTEAAADTKATPAAGSRLRPAPAPVFGDVNASQPRAARKSPAGSPERGEVLEQVLPQVSEKALRTIHGTVRVAVRVEVDAAGNVSAAELESPGPSKYFADLALKAAREWQFASPVSEGRSLPSQWEIGFRFSPSGATATPTQNLP